MPLKRQSVAPGHDVISDAAEESRKLVLDHPFLSKSLVDDDRQRWMLECLCLELSGIECQGQEPATDAS